MKSLRGSVTYSKIWVCASIHVVIHQGVEDRKTTEMWRGDTLMATNPCRRAPNHLSIVGRTCLHIWLRQEARSHDGYAIASANGPRLCRIRQSIVHDVPI